MTPILYSVWLYSRRGNFAVFFSHEDVLSERMLSLKFRALTEPFLGIRNQFSSPAFHIPCCFYFWSLALRMSWAEGEEIDNKVISPPSSIALQRVCMLGENWVLGWNNSGDHVCMSLTLHGSAGTWAVPACVLHARLSLRGSEPALRGQHRPSEPGWASNSGNHTTYAIVPLRKVSRERVPSCVCASEGFRVRANPLRTWAKARSPINIAE